LLDLAVSLRTLLYVLLPNVLYLTVSQADEGIAFTFALPGGPRGDSGQPLGNGGSEGPTGEWWSPLPSNVLVLSAGGCGHVPLPLLPPVAREKARGGRLIPANLSSYTALLVGGMTGSTRRQVLRSLILSNWRSVKGACVKNWPIASSELGRRGEGPLMRVGTNASVQAYQGSNWVEEALLARSLIVPRGFGRSSFMLYETLQVLSFVHERLKWVSPYRFHLCLYFATASAWLDSNSCSR
jgi:hypothetical protein